MASTNKTEFYDLSQYVASDKPTYLTDYNNDMDIIDGAIHSVDVKAGVAETKADSADTKADNAQTTATEALNSAGSANTNIGTMANLDTTNKSTLVGAINEVKDESDTIKSILNNLFNMTSFVPNITVSQGSLVNDMYVAKNPDSSLFKFYGRIVVQGINNNAGLTIVVNAGLQGVTSEYSVAGHIRFLVDSQGGRMPQPATFTVKTNGNIEISVATDPGFPRYDFFFSPCIYINKDFGD